MWSVPTGNSKYFLLNLLASVSDHRGAKTPFESLCILVLTMIGFALFCFYDLYFIIIALEDGYVVHPFSETIYKNIHNKYHTNIL